MKNHFSLTHESLSPLVFNELLHYDNCGAEAIFNGVVRHTNWDKRVTHLEFEAYSPMVFKQLELISTELRNQYDIRVIALHHRVGIVSAGESAVLAGISSPHRQDAFAALSELMNKLKTTVPIWKKEVYTNGHLWLSSSP
jgi:molybdopterin synthase catalytic subunit